MRYRNGVLTCSLVVFTALAAAGCSAKDEHRGFAVPKQLCGVSAPSATLSRLLPSSGENLTTKQDGSLDDDKICDVIIDKSTVLIANNERIDAGGSAQHIFINHLHAGAKRVMNGGDIAYDDWAAVSLVKCRGKGVVKEDISTLISIHKPGRPNESAMRTLISGYDAALRRQKPCHPDSG